MIKDKRQKEIQKILDMSKQINQEEIGDKKGNLDFQKLSSHPIHKEQIKKLKEIEVSGEELRSRGFILGAMILSRFLKK